MRELLRAVVALSISMAACGGPKPPMVPDSPDPALVGDAGAEAPAPANTPKK